MVSPDQARQIERLGGSIEGHCVLLGVAVDHLCGDVLLTGADDIRPDLVRDNIDTMPLEDLHGLLQLPTLPDPACGVVGGAE